MTPFVKLYENTKGVTWGKQMNIIQAPNPSPQQRKKAQNIA
jgi:hypothetical protein